MTGESGDGRRARIWSLRRTAEVLAEVRRVYQGPVVLATDRQCLALR